MKLHWDRGASNCQTNYRAYSEFGRRVQENGSLRTDHGTASRMFLVTPEGHKKSRAGLIGKHPGLTDFDKEADMNQTSEYGFL